MSNFDGYVFVDLETTGLDPNTCDILEVGILVVDKNFNTLATFNEVAYFNVTTNWESIPEVVQEMHAKTGLWDECRNSRWSLRAVEASAVDFLLELGVDKQHLSGSTINFDRSFLAKHMPKLHDTFHYRNYDVSTIKGLFEKYGWPTNPIIDNEHQGMMHRALHDCYDSMSWLKMYVELIDDALSAT